MMDALATGLLGVLLAGYLVLGGADLGVGMLLPVLGRDQAERRAVLTAVVPFFLASEVWLVALVGVLAGAFPGVEKTVFQGTQPFVTTLVTAWVVRDTGLWLRGRIDTARWRSACDIAVTAGSWGLVVSVGAIAGLVVGGLPGPNLGILLAMPVVLVIAAHGAAIGRRLHGRPGERARQLSAHPALTTSLLVAVPLLLGTRLPLESGRSEPTAILLTATTTALVLPLLVAAQCAMWRMFRPGTGDVPFL